MTPSNNKLIIIAAPSGAGKTSVTRHLLKALPNQLAFSISCATRQPRNNEKQYSYDICVYRYAFIKKANRNQENISRYV